ncbi:MAG: chemotaxis protein CheV [Curvibacter lanceolatus]|uniref:chemotaxis protein n=1 Tax=Curvibacter lanceolatus TaxID=86182 RepID=UPI0003A07D15|nr:chemotaxis protein [Curvibacter lanceolatus]MBV5296517.1 chemotaxis protein CheV [Curvibacter lanceolatus]
MTSEAQREIDERTNLTSSNKFELLLFRLGKDAHGDKSELFGINVFKVREIVEMPKITAIIGAAKGVLGVVNLRGQVIQVIDLPFIVGCQPVTGLNIMLVAEFARHTIAFAVEAVEEIVRLDWTQVLAAEGNAASGMVTSIARLDGDVDNTRLVQVLDVEAIQRRVSPTPDQEVNPGTIGPSLNLRPGSVVLAADDSPMARTLMEKSLEAMGAPFVMTRSGKEAWETLQRIEADARKEGLTIRDKVALVLTDLEMPEMDGFTLTRNIKQDVRFSGLPVVIHSSLSGTTNEDHVKSVGADAYVAKFAPAELAQVLRSVMSR